MTAAMTLHDAERIAYITGDPACAFYAEAIEHEAHASELEKELDEATTKADELERRLQGLDDTPAAPPELLDRLGDLQNQFAKLRDQLDAIAHATGQARACALKDALLKPIRRATRARIDAQDALQELYSMIQ